jgi:monofunctional chorismate mutase
MDYLNNKRKKINKLDKKIIILLRKRFAVTSSIGKYKRENSINVLDSGREKIILDKLSSNATETLSKEAIINIYTQIMSESKKEQINSHGK